MNSFKILAIDDGSSCTDDTYIDKKFLVLPASSRYTVALKDLLKKWQLDVVYTVGSFLPPDKQETAEEKDIQREEEVEKIVEKEVSYEDIKNVYNEFFMFTARLYESYRQTASLDTDSIFEKTANFCNFIQINKQPLLILQTAILHSEDNYVVSHSVRTCIFGVIIGMELDLPQHRLVDLAIACLLHPIGLLHLPDVLYLSDKKLSEEERMALHAYPVISCKVLRQANFPLAVCLGVLDHKENADGSGYPKKLTGDKISTYGKVIAVASSYEAAISPRTYKKVYEPAVAIVNIIQQEKSRYDQTVLRAFVSAFSLFPIGSFVILSDKNIAQVADSNPDDPRCPIVRVFYPHETHRAPELIKTSITGIHIVRYAPRESWEQLFTLEH
ncbi:MAG: HD-GYP domain-containing protein [Treponema sp.]